MELLTIKNIALNRQTQISYCTIILNCFQRLNMLLHNRDIYIKAIPFSKVGGTNLFAFLWDWSIRPFLAEDLLLSLAEESVEVGDLASISFIFLK